MYNPQGDPNQFILEQHINNIIDYNLSNYSLMVVFTAKLKPFAVTVLCDQFGFHVNIFFFMLVLG